MQSHLQQRSMRGCQSATKPVRGGVSCRVFSAWPKKAGPSDDANPGPPDIPAPRKIIREKIIAEGREWIETILSRFGPIKERAQTVTTLDFEKPLLELDKRIKEVGRRPMVTQLPVRGCWDCQSPDAFSSVFVLFQRCFVYAGS